MYGRKNDISENPFKLVINTFLILLFLLLIIYLAIRGFQIFGPREYQEETRFFLADYLSFISVAWEFLRPLIQLVIMLAIVEWLLKRLGISSFNDKTKFEWNIQTIIALI